MVPETWESGAKLPHDTTGTLEQVITDIHVPHPWTQLFR